MTTKIHDSAAEPTGAWLVLLIAELLGIDKELIHTDRPIGELGIDSLTAAQLSVEVEERTGANIPLQRFLGDETLAELVTLAERGKAGARSDTQGTGSGEASGAGGAGGTGGAGQ
jgi:acyl carrier protein